jgi:hypothetical protein
MQKLTLKPIRSLERELKLASKACGRNVWVRYDLWRTEKKYTILVGGARLCDTDEPTKALREFRYAEFRKQIQS